jgi:RHS repeat-associated protein
MNGQTLLTSFVPLPGQATAVYASSGLDHYRHSDWLGTERVRTDLNANLYESCTSLPFGDALNCTGSASTLHFTGKERDSESDLDDFSARFYGSGLGRFTSPDPLGILAAKPTFPQSWNLYSYVVNNPLNLTDPTGLWCVWEEGTHDDDPKDGGATSTQCKDQGGHWDQSDTVRGIWNDKYGNVTAINFMGQIYSGFSPSLDDFDSWPFSYNYPNTPTMRAAPRDCSLTGRLSASLEVNAKGGLSAEAGNFAADTSVNWNLYTGQVTAHAGVQGFGAGPEAQRSPSPGNLTPDNVDPSPKFTWNTTATETNLVSGKTELNPSAPKALKFGGAFIAGADVSLDLQKFNELSAACKQPW